MASSDVNRKTRELNHLGKEKVVGKASQDADGRLMATRKLSSSPVAVMTLEEGACEVFGASLSDIKRWARWCRKVGSKPEPLLFFALVCGFHFRVIRLDIDNVLDRLRTWLTSYPQEMDHDLAEVIIDAFALPVRQAIARRGSQKGWPEGSSESKRGKPHTTRGVWAVSVLADYWLCAEGIQKSLARDLAKNLTAILLRRGISDNEFYRIRKHIPTGAVSCLADILKAEFERLVTEDGLRANDRVPKEKESEKYYEWREQHAKLIQILQSFGLKPLMASVLDESRIPQKLWAPFWEYQLGSKKKGDDS